MLTATVLAVAILIIQAGVVQAVTGTFTATTTVANVTALTDQTDVTTATVANVASSTLGATMDFAGGVAEVKAKQTLTVASLPASSTTMTIGSCTVVFATVASTTGDSLDCTGGTAVIDRDTGTGDVARSAAEIATVIGTITNITDTVFGAMATSTTGAGVIVYTATATTATSSQIAYTDGTTVIGNTAVTSVIGVAATGTITVPAALVVSAAEHSISFDSNVIDLGTAALTTAQIATLIASSSNAAATGTSYVADGTYTATSSGAVITFTRSATGVAGNADVTLSDPYYGAKAQINTITIGGTVEAGDIFTATLPGSVDAAYTASSTTDTTVQHIANGLYASILASSGYASQAFTAATGTNTVVLTAKIAGVGFTQTSTTTNRTAVAQVSTFVPASTTAGEAFTATIGSNSYTRVAASGDTVATIVGALATLMNADAAVACVDTASTTITCTASTAGTPFTFTGTVALATAVTASPAAGSYTGGQAVTLTASGASSIRYTLDGTTPTCSTGLAYSSAVTVNFSGSLKAIACYTGGGFSTVSSDAYIISSSGSSGSYGSASSGATTPVVTTPVTPVTPTTPTPTPAPKTLAELMVMVETLKAQIAAMTGATPAVAVTPGFSFTKPLFLNNRHSDVRELQVFLNGHGFVVASMGAGSSGKETDYFGPATKRAIQKFQEQYGLAKAGDAGYGFVGPKTRAKLNELMK